MRSTISFLFGGDWCLRWFTNLRCGVTLVYPEYGCSVTLIYPEYGCSVTLVYPEYGCSVTPNLYGRRCEKFVATPTNIH